ncbi:MAG: hypothetical protein ACP6IS_00375 [Candidatus Asgardarchaeia archaeon]
MYSVGIFSLNEHELFLIIFLNISIWVILYISHILRRNGYPVWIPRKLTHMSIGTAIALALPYFNSLITPVIALGLFLLVLGIGLIFDDNFARKLLKIGTRNGELLLDTLFASITAILMAGVVYFIFYDTPMVYVSGILALAWGDGSGEVIGRPFGKHKIEFLWISKSIEGSLAVFIMSAFAILFSLVIFGNFSIILVPYVFLIGLVISFIELFCYRWIDNLIIPFVSSILVYLLLVS